MQIPWAMWIPDTLLLIEKEGHEFGAVRMISLFRCECRCVRCGGTVLFHARVDVEGDTFGFTPDEVLFDPCKSKFSRQPAA